ncbi:hypothetical protein AF48_00303 [Klebsiella aerogenes MGH 62]|nr:hypothetical protein AF48_00303 [Klebsiella aerogenes MGH 62]
MAFTEIVTPPGEMVLFMAFLATIVMTSSVRAAAIIVALMVISRTARLVVSILVTLLRAILPYLLLPRTMTVIWAIGKSLSAQHAR